MIKQYFNVATIDRSLLARLVALHLVVIAVSNWAVQFGATLWGTDLQFTWGMFTFPVITVATDLTVRLTGKHTARGVVAVAFAPAVLVSAWIATPMIGFASGLAYLLGQLLDVSVFQRIREKWTEAWWVAPAVSTVFANTLDTYTFFWVAFAGTDDPFMAAHWVEIATVDLVFKIVTSLVVFLPAYGALLAYLRRQLGGRPAPSP